MAKITNFDSATKTQVIQELGALNSEDTSLDVSGQLTKWLDAPADLQAIFARIPSHITGLNLRNNNLQKFLETSNMGTLSEIGAQIPKTIVQLDLEDNLFRLNDSNIQGFIDFLANFSHLQHLSLDLNVDDLSQANLQRLFTSLPKELTTFSLKLVSKKYTQNELSLKNILAAFPNDREFNLSLDLSNFDMGKDVHLLHEGKESRFYWWGKKLDTQVFTSLQSKQIRLTHLGCSNDALNFFILPEKLDFMENIPDTVTTLTLNRLGRRYHDYVKIQAQVIAAIKPSVKILELNDLMFYEQYSRVIYEKENFQCLEQIIEAIPRTVTKLKFCANNLSSLRAEYLEQLFARMPTELEEIDLGDNGFEKYKDDQLVSVFAQLSPKTKIVGLSTDLMRRIKPLITRNTNGSEAIKQVQAALNFTAQPSAATVQTAAAPEPVPLFKGINPAHTQWYTRRNAKEFCRGLLKDYVKADALGSVGLFFTGHWNRHHTDEVRTILANFDKIYGEKTAEQFKALVQSRIEAKKGTLKPDGSLAKRLDECIAIEPRLLPAPS